MEKFEQSSYKEIDEDETINMFINSKVTIQDFTAIKVLGKGAYGKVLLVKYNKTDEIFAMKVLKKKYMKKKNQVEHIKTERRVLVMIFINEGIY